MNRIAFGLLWIFVFTIPWENVISVSSIGAISRMIGVLALASGLLAITLNGKVRTFCFPLILISVFVLYSTLSYFWTVDLALTRVRINTYLQLLGTVWLIWELARERSQISALMQAYVLGSFISSINLIFNYLTGRHYETSYGLGVESRFSVTGFDPNDLALVLALSLPMAWYLTLTQKNALMLWVNRICLLLALFAIMLTGSRGGFLAALFALLIVPWTFSRLTFVQKLPFALIGGIAFYAAFTMIPESSVERIKNIPKEIQSGDLSQRRTVWQGSYETFKQHPIVGVGAGAHKSAVRINFYGRQQSMVAHNTYLSLLTETGVLGFSLFLLTLACIYFSSRGLPNLDRKLAIILLLTWGAGVMSLTWEYRKATWFLLGLLMAQAAVPLQRFIYRTLQPEAAYFEVVEDFEQERSLL